MSYHVTSYITVLIYLLGHGEHALADLLVFTLPGQVFLFQLLDGLAHFVHLLLERSKHIVRPGWICVLKPLPLNDRIFGDPSHQANDTRHRKTEMGR